MVVNIVIKDIDWDVVSEFIWEDDISIVDLIRKNNSDIQTSCNIWNCGICKSTILSGHEYIDIEKKSKMKWDLMRKVDGTYRNIFSCIAGVKTIYIEGLH